MIPVSKRHVTRIEWNARTKQPAGHHRLRLSRSNLATIPQRRIFQGTGVGM